MKRAPHFSSDCGPGFGPDFSFDFRSLSALAPHGAADDPPLRILTLSLT
jgi:hypothetical protein